MQNLKSKIVFLALLAATVVGIVSWVSRGWEATLMLVVCVAAHELAHAAVYRIFGVRVGLKLSPFGIGVVADGNQVMAKLNQFKYACVCLAGPATNFFLLLAGIILIFQGHQESGKTLTLLNGLLLTFNLVPLGPFDGAGIVRSIFASLDRKDRRTLAAIAIAVLALVPLSTLALNMRVLGLMLAPFALGYFLLGKMDYPPEKYYPVWAMTKFQAIFLTGVHLTIFILGVLSETLYL